MRDKRSGYYNFDNAKECLEYFHNRQYSNLCSEISLDNFQETTFEKSQPEEDNTILLLM